MPDGETSIILVCPCGMKLRAPGARPGRVGRCPKCGGTLKAPAPKPAAEPKKRRPVEELPPIPDEKPRPDRKETRSPPAAPEDALPERVGMTPKKRKPGETGAIGREGLVAAPEKSRPGLMHNLFYPIWDGTAMILLAILPALLTATSLLSIGLIPNYVIGGGLALKMGALTMVFPMTALSILILGYLLAFLSEIVLESGGKEVYHPKIPPWSIGTTFSSLWIWGWSLGVALLLVSPMVYPLYKSLPPVGEFGPAQWATAGLLITPAMIYAPMALVAVLLHGSVLAANPLTVLKGLFRSGSGAIPLTIVFAAAYAMGVFAVVMLFAISDWGGILVAIGAAWVFWLVFVYAAMVLSRVLGLFYGVNATKIGWFPDRPRWGIGKID